jgi:tetratricopeptide (TPR) repeat protein
VLQNDYDFRGALAALDQAVARDPSDATAHQRRAEVLLALGRLPEAEAAGRRALALDPLAAVVNHALATVLLTAGRDDDEAIRLWRRAVALEPDVPLFRLLLVFAYVELGRPAEAEAVAREGGDTSRVARAIRRGLGDPAHAREARAAVAAWRAAVPDRVSGYAALAWWYARLGSPDSALVMLRRGAAEREPGIPGVLESQSLRGLRTDPRWAEIVREVRGR